MTLQKKSVNMSTQLANRQALKGPLSSFIEDMAVSEALIMYVFLIIDLNYIYCNLYLILVELWIYQ